MCRLQLPFASCSFIMRSIYAQQVQGLFAAVLLSCALQAAGQPPQGATGINGLALNFYSVLTAQDPSTNVFFSPFSISSAFSYVYLGARGNTKAELDWAFGFGTQGFFNPSNLVQQRDTGVVQLLLANRLFLQRGFLLKPEFTQMIPDATAIEVLDFLGDTQGSLQAINQFVNTMTRGYIPNILSSVRPDTLMVIANAIFFKGIWQTSFDARLTRKAEFQGFDRSFSVDMMVREDAMLRYAQNFPIRNTQVSGSVEMLTKLDLGMCSTFLDLLPEMSSGKFNLRVC